MSLYPWVAFDGFQMTFSYDVLIVLNDQLLISPYSVIPLLCIESKCGIAFIFVDSPQPPKPHTQGNYVS